MDSPILSRRDLDFLLYEVLATEALARRPRFADHSRETFDAVIDMVQDLAHTHFLPLAGEADSAEPTFDGAAIHCLPAARAAIRTCTDTGFLAAIHDYELGGMQLPFTVTQACLAWLRGASVGLAGYMTLTMAAANLLRAHGSPQQWETYLKPMLAGRFFGTMVLTEPQAGSSLSDLKATAEPAGDGSYRLVGNKIFISGGDQDISENIIHLVLARIKGAPPGVKGLSLFIVPKILVGEDGSLGERNDVTVAGLIHKMGYRGLASIMLNLGEQGRCVGYLVGEAGRGLDYMFHMMNEARTAVGMGAAVIGYSSYRYALDYARNRPQGRAPSAKDPTSPQVPIIEHADVRRLLLAQKAIVEGALMLCLYSARLVDDAATAVTPEERETASLLLGVLTPIVKAWSSDYCVEACSQAIQVHGGYGYSREYAVERLFRDNRLNPLHEGTNGIQALDLLGRKVRLKNGAAFAALSQRIADTVAEARSVALTAPFADALEAAAARARDTTATLVAAAGDIDRYLANATVYLHLLGHTVVAWLWVRQAVAAARALPAAQGEDRGFYEGKLTACRYFLGWELPRTEHWGRLLTRFDDTCLSARPEHF